jgi:ATP-dependent RNA helicase RhlE
MTFAEFRLAEPILRAVIAEGYTIPTPIQEKAIPHVMEGHDVLGCAQTGTGKTAAFALPILHRLGRSRSQDRRHVRAIRVLILAPTRELAAQIGDSFRAYGRHTQLRHAVIFGGVNQNPQVQALRSGVDILVATPGRLLDLMEQGYVHLQNVEVLVLDEADRMLDMGFIRDIRKIVAQVPTERQTLLFSATMPADIRELANAILRNPVAVRVAAVSAAADTVQQSVFFVEKRSKPAMLEHFLNHNAATRVLVFTRTKHGADRVARQLSKAGIPAEAIHGNKSQNARTRAMNQFKSQAPPVLVATDIAARGLDIDEISHVINYDLPNEPETYVHRIGRTGRAGASGLAVSFCDTEEMPFLRDIERLIRKPIPVNPERPKLPPPPPRRPANGGRPQQPRAQQPRAQQPRSQQRPQQGRPQEAPSSRRSRRQERVNAGPREQSAPPIPMPVRVERATDASGDGGTPRPVGVGYRSRGRSGSRRRR